MLSHRRKLRGHWSAWESQAEQMRRERSDKAPPRIHSHRGTTGTGSNYSFLLELLLQTPCDLGPCLCWPLRRSDAQVREEPIQDLEAKANVHRTSRRLPKKQRKLARPLLIPSIEPERIWISLLHVEIHIQIALKRNVRIFLKNCLRVHKPPWVMVWNAA